MNTLQDEKSMGVLRETVYASCKLARLVGRAGHARLQIRASNCLCALQTHSRCILVANEDELGFVHREVVGQKIRPTTAKGGYIEIIKCVVLNFLSE